jgi:hypothetical protein
LVLEFVVLARLRVAKRDANATIEGRKRRPLPTINATSSNPETTKLHRLGENPGVVELKLTKEDLDQITKGLSGIEVIVK